MQPDLEALKAATPAKDIHTKPGRGQSGRLSYVTARFVMDRLDAAVGPENWQDRYEDRTDGSVRCGIGIRFDEEWVWKWDVGTESDIESEKGLHSDAFKRAGVKWGIARDLYDGGTTHGPVVGNQATVPAQAGRGSSPTPRPAASTVPPEPTWMNESSAVEQARAGGPGQPVGGIEPGADDGTCPQHGKPWRENAKGFYCGTPIEKSADGAKVLKWCDERPTQRWVTARGLVAAR